MSSPSAQTRLRGRQSVCRGSYGLPAEPRGKLLLEVNDALDRSQTVASGSRTVASLSNKSRTHARCAASNWWQSASWSRIMKASLSGRRFQLECAGSTRSPHTSDMSGETRAQGIRPTSVR